VKAGNTLPSRYVSSGRDRKMWLKGLPYNIVGKISFSVFLYSLGKGMPCYYPYISPIFLACIAFSLMTEINLLYSFLECLVKTGGGEKPRRFLYSYSCFPWIPSSSSPSSISSSSTSFTSFSSFPSSSSISSSSPSFLSFYSYAAPPSCSYFFPLFFTFSFFLSFSHIFPSFFLSLSHLPFFLSLSLSFLFLFLPSFFTEFQGI
jgi:hypothetical protein